MAWICNALGEENDFAQRSKQLNFAIHQAFFDPVSGFYRDRILKDQPEKETKSVLGNSLAVLCGACPTELSEKICAAMWEKDHGLTPISLSMRCFFYDACLLTHKAYYAPLILEDIQRIYRPMVELGVGTVWETEAGQADFDNAGSLCHGWSALPIYYYHTLKS